MKIEFTNPSEDHLADYFKGLSDREIYRYMPIHYNSLESTREQLEFYQEGVKSGKAIHKNVLIDGNFAGVVSFFKIELKHKRGEIGYWFLKDFHGKGVAFNSVKEFISDIYKTKEINRIEAKVDARNIPSKKLARKLGFKLEGVKREVEWEDGKPVDIEYYSLLRREWNFF